MHSLCLFVVIFVIIGVFLGDESLLYKQATFGFEYKTL